MRVLSLLTAALLLPAASGCLNSVDLEERLGIIQILPAHPAAVDAPATAEVDEPFTVQVITHGGGCLRPGPTRVRTDGLTADVSPYDVDTGGGCAGQARMYRHLATLRFGEAGTATVHVRGIGHPGGDVVTVTRTITIR